MRTASFRHEITIDRPAPEVWALLADYGNDPAWRAGVRTMNPDPAGPVRPGTTTLEVLRLGGRTYRIPGEVIDVDEGRSFGWRASVAAGRRQVEPVGEDRCRVVLTTDVTLTGMERMMAPVLVRMLRRRLEGDLVRLSALASSGAPGGTGRRTMALA